MKFVFCQFEKNQTIPVTDYVSNKKLVKYYNRETQAAMVCVGMLLKDIKLNPDTPIFYGVGVVDNEEFELDKIANASADANRKFNNQLFIEKGMPSISPLTQFKVLYNMTLCFISIEYGLKGDNAAIYSSAGGLLTNALYSGVENEMLVGAGKIYDTGKVETGFALLTVKEIESIPYLTSNEPAIEIFKELQKRKENQ